MLNLGVIRPGSTIRIPFGSFDKDDGSSITMTNFAVGDILVYKDGGTTERASTAGYTATTDFDSKTGKHVAIIDLADNTTAGFWNAGSEYLVAIDAVTIDAVTTGGWIARFQIGYAGANLDTTIATLASQASFTLTAGPAEDDALNGHWAIIHDIASAVQRATVLILDYTGSTKTVTLAAGATFTVAAGDNISIMDLAPLQPTVLGRTFDVSATGEGGLDWANIGGPTTSQNLSGTTVKTATDVETDTQDLQARVPAALVSGRMDASVGAMAANVMTAAALATDAVAEIQSGLATAVNVAAVAGDVWQDSAMNTAGTKGELLTQAQSSAGSAHSATTTILNRLGSFTGSGVNTVLGFLKAALSKTASLPSDIGGTFDPATDSTEAIKDLGVAAVSGAVGSVTGNVGGNVTGSVGSLATQAKADVNAEVVDCLNVDTYAEPTTAPAATSTLRAKIGWIFKRMRNKEDSSATAQRVYADDASTVDSSATLSDSAGVFTRGEFS